MKRLVQCVLASLCITFLLARTASPNPDVSVMIDGATEHQTIEGFGGAESWRLPPASMYPTLFNDLGVSILRFQMFAYTESTPDLYGDEARDNDNNDPSIINWNNVATGSMNAFAPLLQAAQSRGVKIIGTTWSPPAWMKVGNQKVEVAGDFQTGYEDELVEFILIWVKGMEQLHGVHIDSVTIQNEPDNHPAWAGCYYTPDQLADIIKRLGARFTAEGITTEIHAPDMTSLNNFVNYANVICQDSDAKGYLDRLATHPYWDTFDPADSQIPKWVSAYNLAKGCGKQLWQTEYENGSPQDWSQLIVTVQHIHNALVHGHVTAWLNYELYKTGSGGGGLLDENGKFHKFYALKQYYRYVRPGAIRVDSVSSDTNILVTAFNHKVNNNFTIVGINRDTTDKVVSFDMNNIHPISRLEVYRSSSTEYTNYLGQVQVSGNKFTSTLPKESITTFTTGVLTVTLPGSATEGDGVLNGQGTVSMSGTLDSDLLVTLSSNDTSEMTVPTSVTITAGHTSTIFDLSIVDDGEIDGTQSATVTASAAGFSDGSATIDLLDNETPKLSLAIPVSATEGSTITQGTVGISATRATDLVISLSSSDTSEITVPSTVTIIAGNTSAIFDLTIVDDVAIDGTQSAAVTASATGFTDGTDTIDVLDNETTDLTVAIPGNATEGDGVLSNQGTVSISGTRVTDLVVSLNSSDTSEVTVPSTVTIIASITSANFDLTIVDDTNKDGMQTVTVTAATAGFTSGQDTIDVADDEPIPGDIDDSGGVDLADAILALQVLNMIQPVSPIRKEADINGDGRIGMEESIHILQTVSKLR